MDVNVSASQYGVVALFEQTPVALRFLTKKERRYLLERHHVRAKLENPGGSVLLTASALVDSDRPEGYSSQVGSDSHLDLIEAEVKVNDLLGEGLITKQDVADVLAWFDSLDSLSASKFLDGRLIDDRPRKRKKHDLPKSRSNHYQYRSPAEESWIETLSDLTKEYQRPVKTRRKHDNDR